MILPKVGNLDYNLLYNQIKLLDKAPSKASFSTAKTPKNIKTLKIPVARYFDSPAQISSYYAEGEYDIVQMFKLLKYESIFQKSVQKKIDLLSKAGAVIHSDNDEVRDYFKYRFHLMQLQTGRSLENIIKTLAYYLLVCSNAWIVKVRDPNFELAKPYELDGKMMEPVVGLFLAHPSTMKPKFHYVKDTTPGYLAWQTRIELWKWVHINRRGVFKEFELDDVSHFVLNREDGLVFGMPEIIPVIDDIRTLRKMEEDVQLLLYRDLFPIIHYTIDKPEMIDHTSGLSEIDKAKNDMQNLIQDGGIATDKRHEINFVGNQGKGVDATPYLEYFRQRVYTGLGVSATDMGVGQDVNNASANSMSKQMIDSVKSLQREIIDQFNNLILHEMCLQSPFEDIFDENNRPTLKFEEIDIEWKIKQENHEADLFSKGVSLIHETRNKLGKRDASDDDLAYTYQGLYSGIMPSKTLETPTGEEFIKNQQKLNPPKQQVTNKANATTRNASSTRKGSSASRDQVKSAKSNSNITKRKDELLLQDILLEDSMNIKDQFQSAIENILQDSNKSKLDLMLATKCTYDIIKDKVSNAYAEGISRASEELNVEPKAYRADSRLYSKIDDLRDNLTDYLKNNPNKAITAAARVAATVKTECLRAANYGYLQTLFNNNVTKAELYHPLDNISEDTLEYIGKEIDLTQGSLLDLSPPYRINSGLSVRLKQEEEK